MAAYAALASLLNNIEQMMRHPTLSTSFDNIQIQFLEEKAALLLDFIETYNYVGGVSEEVQDLESLIASAAHTAEDMIESHIVNQLLPLSAHDREAAFSFSLYLQKKRAIEEKNEAAVGDVDQFHGESNLSNFDYLRQIIEDMDAIIHKASELKEKQRFREEHSTPPLTLSLTRTREETAVVGFGDELIQLLDELTGDRSNLHIISIVGMGGMGKTTLAKNIYAHQLIIERFDIRAWATVSHQYNAEQILQQLVFGQGKSSDKNVDELGEQLHKTLFGRRYLIILDDIWSVEAWDEVRRFFPDNGNGSRIVLTTRLSEVANNCGSSCFAKNFLDENKSWELFCKKAFQNEDCPTELEEVGKEIVRLCKGLALSIVVIGGSLRKSPRTVRYWKSVAKDIESSPNSKEKQESLDVLISSYNHLPSHLKPCFLHIGVLKHITDESLNISRIIQLWVGEGFLKSNGGRVLEEIAEDYLKELVDRNLILVGRRSKNGKMKSCDIHDLLRDLCLKVGEQQGLFNVISGGPIQGTERRLVCNKAHWWSDNDRPLLTRSMVGYVGFYMDTYKHRLLRIFDAEYYEEVKELFGGVNLRCLAGVRAMGCDVFELPSSISLVWNLHSLIFQKASWSRSRVVAPIEIWKMRQLRHIQCANGIYLPHPNGQLQDEFLILENFQTLGKAVNLRLSEDVCNIIPNIKILHLEYDRDLEGYDDSLMECLCNLDRLHKLESLKLEVGFRWRRMYSKLNEIVSFPRSLNKLRLSRIDFEWDDLTMIGSLPILEVLRIEFNWNGSTWSPVDGQFQRLKFLKIDWGNLTCWNADSCHFPILEKLLLCRLLELEEIPWGIGEIPTLKLIHLDRCSNSVAISAIKIKDEQLQYQENDDDLQIQIRVDEYKLESFMAMVETEGLTLDHNSLAPVHPAKTQLLESDTVSNLTSTLSSSSVTATPYKHISIETPYTDKSEMDSLKMGGSVEAEVLIKHLREAKVQVSKSKDVGPSKNVVEALINIIIEEFRGSVYEEDEWLDKLLSSLVPQFEFKWILH
ncbi:putative late blight resistance protein homolog R1A-3 [Salvia miltiorrhiza]|uniref:putative late blight resistance protein homolog R1A-3 n=1 Tax=Salvia miltiorrhiza TaxID=226208 RepID=UPI0025AD719F|nr:putative late blight resistance protein homolog R1A-3 [Salvia miltiorrhiza]